MIAKFMVRHTKWCNRVLLFLGTVFLIYQGHGERLVANFWNFENWIPFLLVSLVGSIIEFVFIRRLLPNYVQSSLFFKITDLILALEADITDPLRNVVKVQKNVWIEHPEFSISLESLDQDMIVMIRSQIKNMIKDEEKFLGDAYTKVLLKHLDTVCKGHISHLRSVA